MDGFLVVDQIDISEGSILKYLFKKSELTYIWISLNKKSVKVQSNFCLYLQPAGLDSRFSKTFDHDTAILIKLYLL